MLTFRPRPAGWAWVGLVGYVVSVDAFLIYMEKKGAPDYCTMSTAFEEALRHPLKRLPVTAAWGLVTVHLFDVVLLPENMRKYEPIGFIGDAISGFFNRRLGTGAVSALPIEGVECWY